jgi:hypothetical protein
MEIVRTLITRLEALAGENAHLRRRIEIYRAQYLSSNEPKPRKRQRAARATV